MSNTRPFPYPRGGGAGGYVTNLVTSLAGAAVAVVDKVADYDTRRNAYDTVLRFCSKRPVAASFISIQLVFSLIPVLSFLLFSLFTLSFCVLTALAVSAFWIGIAGLFLLCTVSLLAVAAGGVWAYFLCCWYAARFFASYFGLIGGEEKGVVVRSRRRSEESERREQAAAAAADRRVYFEVPGKGQQQQQEQQQQQQQQGQGSSSGAVKEDGTSAKDISGDVPDVVTPKSEDEEEKRVARENSPSQHIDVEYLDVSSVGSSN